MAKRRQRSWAPRAPMKMCLPQTASNRTTGTWRQYARRALGSTHVGLELASDFLRTGRQAISAALRVSRAVPARYMWRRCLKPSDACGGSARVLGGACRLVRRRRHARALRSLHHGPQHFHMLLLLLFALLQHLRLLVPRCFWSCRSGHFGPKV